MKHYKDNLSKEPKSTRKHRKLITLVITVMAIVSIMALPVFASNPTPAPALSINFDIQQMFTWAQTIINAMLPVVYIIMGVALGFLIIRAFKAAFN